MAAEGLGFPFSYKKLKNERIVFIYYCVFVALTCVERRVEEGLLILAINTHIIF